MCAITLVCVEHRIGLLAFSYIVTVIENQKPPSDHGLEIVLDYLQVIKKL